ncbi:MAG: hypothetical protein OHK0019_03650 [Saprospiraceae bacterium]
MLRYNELKKDIPPVTYKMLTTQLRQLEEEGFITRTGLSCGAAESGICPTKLGQRAIPVVEVIRNYGLALMEEFGVEEQEKKSYAPEKMSYPKIISRQKVFKTQSRLSLFQPQVPLLGLEINLRAG